MITYVIPERASATIDNPEPVPTPPRSSQPQIKRRKLTQMTIDLGGPPQTSCKQCGMQYIPSNPEDRKLHTTYHAASVGGVDVPASLQAKKGAHTVARFEGKKGKTDTIVVVSTRDKGAVRRFAKNVLEIVEKELGAVETTEQALWDLTTVQLPGQTNSEEIRSKITNAFHVYLYIRGSKCVGLLLAQRISSAKRQGFAGAASGAAKPDIVERPAGMGVSRIWVSRESQRCGIATELLDAARKTFIGYRIARDQVAFSQPTELGLSLITKYIHGGNGWLLYDEYGHAKERSGGKGHKAGKEDGAQWLNYD